MKYFLSLLLVISFSTYLFAQDHKFEIGVQSGPSITRIRYLSGATDLFKSKAAFSMSMFFQYNLSKNFALRIDPGYENKGYYANYTLTDANGAIIREAKEIGNFNYINIPVLFRASMGNKIKYFINVGPYMGVLLSQHSIYDSPYSGKSKDTGTNYYKTLDFGITSGLGLAIPIKENFALSVEARNNIGLINISNSSNSNVKTLSFNLLVGFAYKFGSNK
jgi:hypothetical protein